MIRERFKSFRLASIGPYLPLLGLLGVALLTGLLIDNVAYCSDADAKCASHRATISVLQQPTLADTAPGDTARRSITAPFAELQGRLTWSISTIFYWLAISIALGLAVVTMLRWSEGRFRTAALLTLIVGAPTVQLLPGAHELPLNRALFDNTIYSFTSAATFVDFISAFAAITVVMLAIAAASVLLRAAKAESAAAVTTQEHQDTTQEHQNEHANNLVDLLRDTRLLLYAAAFALVAGTFQTNALYTWALTLLSSGQLVMSNTTQAYFSKAETIPQTMGMINGALYSLVLTAIFAPAYLQLRAQVARLARNAIPNGLTAERAEWLQKRGLEVTIPKQLTTALAVLAPLIAGGPVTTLLEVITR